MRGGEVRSRQRAGELYCVGLSRGIMWAQVVTLHSSSFSSYAGSG
jgi:hypothetical protein